MGRNGHQNPDLLTLPQTMGQLRADYDAAKESRFRRHRKGIAPMGSGADFHYRYPGGYYGMMELARELFRNNMVVGQGVKRLVANIVQQGFTLEPKTGSEDADQLLAKRWKDYSEDPKQCDMAGEQNFHGLEKLALQHVIVDGDILALLTEDGPIMMVEGHRLKTPMRTTRNVVLGVLLDEFRRRKEYWVAKDNISPQQTIQLYRDITPYRTLDENGNRQVLQLYRPDRVSQTRGVTAFQPAINTADHGDDLFFAQLIKAQMAACYAIFRQMNPDAPSPRPDEVHGERESDVRPDGSIRTIEGIGPAMEVYGWPGETISGFSPNIPNPEFFQHAMLILQIVAINLDLPLMLFLLDATKTNFSGWRGALDQAKMRFRDFQKWYKDYFHTPGYQWKVRQWLAEDADLRRFEGQGVNLFGHEWHPPSWPYIEPLKDAAADLLEVRNCLISQRRRAARRSLSWPTLVEEIVVDNALLIRRAKQTADALNKEFNGELNITWREVACLPTPDGVSLKGVYPSEEADEEAANADAP